MFFTDAAIVCWISTDGPWRRSLRFCHRSREKRKENERAMSEAAHYDAVIIGAGPAGCAAAAILAERGRRALVLEREKFPRYHIGESLLRFTFAPLHRLGLTGKM